MKTKEQLQESYNEIINKIEVHFNRMVNAMCNGNNYEEQMCNEEIRHLENRKEVLEWVLN